jgi:thioredoxin-dependent peroxiredoxin
MNPGDKIPDFTASDQNGVPVTFSEVLAEGPVVVFFYPKAMTTGCTKESCHFRDLEGEFAAVGARRIGVSADSVERQQKFDQKHALGFTLLSDSDRTIARIFGVKRPGPLMNKRATFVVDRDGTLIEEINSEMNMDVHADRALELLRAKV